MNETGDHVLSRRTLLRGAAGMGLAAVGATLLPGCHSGGRLAPAATDGPPETTTLRLQKGPVSCLAALAVASDFAAMEGFTDVKYVDVPPYILTDALVAGEIDVLMDPAAMTCLQIDAGTPVVMLSGVQAGCYQVFATPAIKSLRDFKGKTVGTRGPNTPEGVFLAVMLGSVGIDVRNDVTLVTHSQEEGGQLLASGQIDGLVAFPPTSLDLVARGVGHVIVDSMMDRPWSQYFCCMATVRRDYLVRSPSATKRALRAVLKGADVVAKDPARAAQAMVDRGFSTDYDGMLRDLRMMPYHVWRQYDPSDSLRFYALRLRDAGLIKATPKQIISRGTDYRFLRELKQELKEA